MGMTVTVLGALVTLLCAVLLLRQYAATRARLLLWSGLCFAVLTLNNVLLVLALICSPLYLLLSRGSLRRSWGADS
jgi:hypothetical protein